VPVFVFLLVKLSYATKENIPFKYVLGKIRMELIMVTLYATAVAFAYAYFDLQQVSLSLGVPMVMGTVISLLLAFRSN
jgi:putative membrane protein